MRLAAVILSLLLASAALAKEKNHYPDPTFLSNESLGRIALIPPVPLRHSATDRADYRKILRYQATRTQEDVRRAAAVVDVKLATLFGPPWGPLTPAEVARWSPFFTKVQLDTDYWVQETKKLFRRLRPYQADRRVHAAVHQEWTRAYPSGHAAISRIFARLLARLDPPRKNEFMARADQIAEDRVLSGLHHPTDIAAGKLLAEKVLLALWETPSFRREFGALQRGR